MPETELIATVTSILEKELAVALGMSLPLFQLEARQKQEKDKLKAQMSTQRQEIEKKRLLIQGLYEKFLYRAFLTGEEYFELKQVMNNPSMSCPVGLKRSKNLWMFWTASLYATGKWKKMPSRWHRTMC